MNFKAKQKPIRILLLFSTQIEKRIAESARIREQYSDRIPLICEKMENSTLPPLPRTNLRFLLPDHITLAQFAYIVRKQTKLSKDQALFFFINGKSLARPDATMGEAYAKMKDPDGFLYMGYSNEKSYG